MPPKLKRISQYVLGKTLGQGTFGKVKYAVDTNTNIPVALKIMDKAKIKAANIGAQIKKEIKVLKMLSHPTCIKLIEVLASDENIFLVMELVSGGELFDRVVANGRFSESEARKYFHQLIDGLEHCHNFGVCHRDLKPENLLLDAHGGLKITDFGLASINEKPEDGMQILHTPCGTPNYVAPEVLMEKGYDGTLADVWSAGVILYLLVSGFLPFDEPQMVDLFRKIVVADYQYPSWLSHEVQQLISRMLEPNVDRRATIQQIKESAWYRGESSSRRKKLISSSSNGRLDDGGVESTTSTVDDHDDMSHIVDMDDDHMMFGSQQFVTTPISEALVLSRQLSGRHHLLGSTVTCPEPHCSHNPYQTKRDPQTGLEKILINAEWRDVREWFYEKYPGKRSVIDENIRREKRAARRAAAAQAAAQGLNPTAITTDPSLSAIGSVGSAPSCSGDGTILPQLTPQSSIQPHSSSGSSEHTEHPDAIHEDDELPAIVAPKQLNAFDLINMVSGQSVNNMLLFNSGQNENGTASNSTATKTAFPASPNQKIGGITTSIDGDNAQYKNQLKQTQIQHQQQSFTQFTCKCPTSLLVKRLDYVLLHVPHVKYRINYKKCHINAVWTNVRNSHQVHEFIEVYSLANDLHMVRCQRVSGSVIAHGEFYRIFKDNIKYLETHAGNNSNSNASCPTPIHHPEGDAADIVVATPMKKKPSSPSAPNSTTSPTAITITEEDIDNYILEWSQDVLIYRDYVMKRHHQMQLELQQKGGDIQPSSDSITSVPPTPNPNLIAMQPILTAPTTPTPLSDEQMQRGLNTFRSLTLNNRSVTAVRTRPTSIAVAAEVISSPQAGIEIPANRLHGDGKPNIAPNVPSSSDDDDDDDDDSSSSDEDADE